MLVSLDEAKSYLRVDSSYEDALISALLVSAEALCSDVARLSPAEWLAVSDYTTGGEGLVIRGESKTSEEIGQIRELLRVGVLYALGYLFEHREEADHHDLTITLRNLLFSVREGVV